MVRSKKIGIIETIRGLAAVTVCLFHFSKCNIAFVGSSSYFLKFASVGWLGVEAFFVVSGFVIPYSLAKANYKISEFFRFFGKRCMRIEPAYLVSIIMVVVLGYLAQKAPGFNGKPFLINPANILLHLGYLPEHFGYTWLLPVYWSLEAEFHYYILIGLCFPFIWKNTRNLLFFTAIGLALSLLIPLYVFEFMPFFIMGIVTCQRMLGKINDYVFYPVLIIAFIISYIASLTWAMPVTGVITALVISHISFETKINHFLGKISFSLYLIHIPVGGKILNYLGRYTHTEMQVWGAVILALLLTILASFIFYKLVEYPSQMLSRKIAYNRYEKGIDHITALPSA